MTDWVWSDWITPDLVLGKADLAVANAGASIRISGADPVGALDSVRGGLATGGSSLAPEGTAPYTYLASGVLNGDGASTAGQAIGYDRAFVEPGEAPHTYAGLNVGYSSGVWRERPELRQVPPEFWNLEPGFDWVPIDEADPTWAGKVEFEPGDTVGAQWCEIWVSVGADRPSTTVGGNVGYAPSRLLPSTSGEWSGTFGWPPPLGSPVLHVAGNADLPEPQPLPVQPPPGSDFTIVVYTDVATGTNPADEAWQQWLARPTGGPLGDILYIWYQMPRYRYRIPVSIQPRFFVRDRTGFDQPVGWGKTTDDVVFMIPTAMGLYRDMTVAEYAANPPPA